MVQRTIAVTLVCLAAVSATLLAGPQSQEQGTEGRRPVLLKEVKPAYTAEALRAKVEGTVELDAVVTTDGSVGDVRVVKSLDQQHGLDNQAIAAARQWQFRPGLDRDGKPVPVVVRLELEFRLAPDAN